MSHPQDNNATSNDGFVRLSDWAVLRARGADAATFLQGQLTQDVVGMAIGEARLSGYCSAKGRLLASFIVWRLQGDEFGLLCSADVAGAMVKRLSMFVLRARCRVDDASAEWSVHGLVGPSVQRWSGGHQPWRARQLGDAWLIALPMAEQVPRWVLVQPAQADPPDLPTLSETAWRVLEVNSGVPRITAATAEHFVPQMINLELVGGVHFQKGCYPGQEVVARSQYRGTIKRRMHLFATNGSARAGQEVFHSDDPGQPAGMIVNAADVSGAGSRVLAEVKLSSLVSGTLHLGQPHGPLLELLPLPYPVPSTADV